MPFCRTICLRPQNTPLFPISLLYWSQISFLGAFFWGLQTASNHWRPDLDKRLNTEAIWSAIHVVLPSLQSTCNTVNYLGERELFSLFVATFWQFVPSNAAIMLYNIHYWWFSLSQGNRSTKYLAHPKIQEAKTLPVDVYVFGHFGQLSFAAVHSSDCFAQSAGAVEYTDCTSAEGLDPLPNECPGYDTEQSDGEVPVMLGAWRIRCTPLLPVLPGSPRPGEVAPDRALSMG